MSRVRTFLAVLAATVVWGCVGRDVSGPVTNVLDLSLTQASPSSILGVAGEVTGPVAVKVVNYPTDQPVAGVIVTFSVVGNPIPAYSAVTNADGIATLDSIRLDPTPGEYRLMASAGESEIRPPFSIVAFSQKPTAIYDLKSIGGQAVTGIPGPSWHSVVTGGHYVLFADGTYVSGGESNLVLQMGPASSFAVQGSQTFHFYSVLATIPGFPPDPKYLFSTGTLIGETMTIKYEYPDPYFGYDPDEGYILRK